MSIDEPARQPVVEQQVLLAVRHRLRHLLRDIEPLRDVGDLLPEALQPFQRLLGTAFAVVKHRIYAEDRRKYNAAWRVQAVR